MNNSENFFNHLKGSRLILDFELWKIYQIFHPLKNINQVLNFKKDFPCGAYVLMSTETKFVYLLTPLSIQNKIKFITIKEKNIINECIQENKELFEVQQSEHFKRLARDHWKYNNV